MNTHRPQLLTPQWCRHFRPAVLGALSLTLVLRADAQDLAFSDPANVTPPPAGAIGFADRSPTLDALPGFQNPPPGFGTVPFYWWLGDPLTKERLGWELEQMRGMGVSGYQINYAHSDKGGRSYGLTYPSEPALFSEDWWKLTGWFMQRGEGAGRGHQLERLHARLRPGLVRGRNPARASRSHGHAARHGQGRQS